MSVWLLAAFPVQQVHQLAGPAGGKISEEDRHCRNDAPRATFQIVFPRIPSVSNTIANCHVAKRQESALKTAMCWGPASPTAAVRVC